MRVFVKFNIGARDSAFPPLPEGEHEVADDLGERLVARGYADSLEAPTSTIKAVPPEPMKAVPEQGTVEQATEDVKAYARKARREAK